MLIFGLWFAIFWLSCCLVAAIYYNYQLRDELDLSTDEYEQQIDDQNETIDTLIDLSLKNANTFLAMRGRHMAVEAALQLKIAIQVDANDKLVKYIVELKDENDELVVETQALQASLSEARGFADESILLKEKIRDCLKSSNPKWRATFKGVTL